MLKMRNCNLELRLVPPCADYDHHLQPMLDLSSEIPNERREEKQEITIFYDGRIRICEVTDIQARAIIMLASREMEENVKNCLLGSETSSSPLIQSPRCSSPGTGLFMKRSLQRFLQKRMNRIQATSPYRR